MFICDISILNKYGKTKLDEMLQPINLSWREMVVLMVVEQASGANPLLIGTFIQQEKGNTTKLLNKMEDRQLIHRQTNSQDRRYKGVFLTDFGQSLLPKLHQIMDEWEAFCYGALSEQELDQYRQLNLKIIRALTGTNYKEESR